MSRRFRLDGRCVLVTGASSGLGRHFAGVLAGAGGRVVLGARRADRIEAARDQIEAAGGEAACTVMDVTDTASVGAAFDAAEVAFGTVGVLVNNAGVSIMGRALEVEEADWDAVLDTNLNGAWRVAQEAARRMVEAGTGGTIVNVASIAGQRQVGGLISYATSKAGLIQVTKIMALELARHGIRVNALAPGYVETDLNREYFAGEAGARLIGRIPQRRLAALADLDGPLLLLASDASAYMTGAVVNVDGGHLVSSL